MNDESPKPVIVISGTGAENMRALAAIAPLSTPKREIAHVAAAPNLQGSFGAAWKIDWLATRPRLIEAGKITGDAAHDSGVAIWIARAPYAHPVWHRYLLILVHLRDVGLPTKRYVPGATHEFWLAALDPDAPIDACLAGDDVISRFMLQPLNFAAQLVCRDDDEAEAIIARAAQDVISGRLNPDTDYLATWSARFGAGMVRSQVGAAKQRRDALARFEPWPEDFHVCPRCRSRRTAAAPGPAMALSHVPTPFAVCADCNTMWEAYPPGWQHDAVEASPCDNCAFAKGSPESTDREGWRAMLDDLQGGREFNCHKGAPMLIDHAAGTVEFDEAWVAAHGRTCAGFLRAMQRWPDWLKRRYPGLLVDADDEAAA